MIQIPELKITTPDPYYTSSVEYKAVLDLAYYLSFVNLSLSAATINYHIEKGNYVEAIIELDELRIEITKFLNEPTGYSVISKDNTGNLKKADYYTESLIETVKWHLDVFQKPYIMYE